MQVGVEPGVNLEGMLGHRQKMNNSKVIRKMNLRYWLNIN